MVPDRERNVNMFDPHVDPHTDLIAEYEAWCAEHRLPCMSADELMVEMSLSPGEHLWLANYLKRWDAATEEVL